ncbi:conserved exported hypothetical protein [Vibrio nigripulchritudo SFn27]|uniref:Carbonic anhydrase n=1 Tax=Vibrio nigripulchritudo TaxID=28173 RepID=A0A9P1NJN8_9VIBR|nr:carbonic anhydrase [Vibrio nigripulchritudo]CBJ93212.1 Carbonic anhydrase (Carbonate dehydratase) [Vibrio nigripulchritudo]CCN86037.1 conserved exported hypothetical protein [Vibrio nigripulchritudo BLFn1]CCN92024.1 conserved exported hypothetical protein [Vibrio nigripulchritudo SFn27]CCN97835.1 conserved exported hypothetical protein [Vibrio nigripulchritudo ENn2]CCO44058.1 conserved exported hypothetical protein [Vibrio nigripulchritudo SFn135]
MKMQCMALGLLLALTGPAQASTWGYEGQQGPAHWGKVAKECSTGQNQSPVNIASTTKAKLGQLQFDYQGRAIAILNNGHTLQTTLEGRNTLTIDGKRFKLKQFHFHTPSENQVDGKVYPMEAHLVHADKMGHLAVVAVFFTLGQENPNLAALLKNVPGSEQRMPISEPIETGSLLPASRDYYRFNGSLTTPPCSEGVRWIVMKDPLVMSRAQLQLFMQAMGSNSRPVQPVNARLILAQH